MISIHVAVFVLALMYVVDAVPTAPTADTPPGAGQGPTATENPAMIQPNIGEGQKSSIDKMGVPGKLADNGVRPGGVESNGNVPRPVGVVADGMMVPIGGDGSTTTEPTRSVAETTAETDWKVVKTDVRSFLSRGRNSMWNLGQNGAKLQVPCLPAFALGLLSWLVMHFVNNR